jgi:hypothetical protein
LQEVGRAYAKTQNGLGVASSLVPVAEITSEFCLR